MSFTKTIQKGALFREKICMSSNLEQLKEIIGNKIALIS